MFDGMVDESTHCRIKRRAAELQDWLEQEAPYVQFDQRHLDPHTPEQAYWHFGYQRALTDILALLRTQIEGSGRTASPSPPAEPDGSR